MKTTDILFIIVWMLIMILTVIVLIKTFKAKPLNHLPTYDYPLKEVYFEITEIKSVLIEDVVVEYTAVVSFFKKPNAKHFVYNEYKFYDKKDKYSIGDKLYLTKKQ